MKVAAAPDESVGLLMDGVLKDAGIPSLIQRAAGFDAPDFLAAGSRERCQCQLRWLKKPSRSWKKTRVLGHTCRSAGLAVGRNFTSP